MISLFSKIFAHSKDELSGLPWRCQGCELLGICRRSDDEWKLRGSRCMLSDDMSADEFERLMNGEIE